MTTGQCQATAMGGITLRGSAEMVAEFFNYGVNNILYQRGVYPMESFKRTTAYGIPMFVSDKEEIADYVNKICEQVTAWLMEKTIQRLVLVITSVDSGQDIERWDFKVECDKAADESTEKTDKSVKEIRKEIQNVCRQITSTVTFLPYIDELCSFEILIYTDKNSTVPETWEDSDAHYIADAQEVKLQSFDTLIHKVNMGVCYKVE